MLSPLLVDSASASAPPPTAFPSLFLCFPRGRGNLNLPPVVDEWADDEFPGDLILLGKFNAVAFWQLGRLIFYRTG